MGETRAKLLVENDKQETDDKQPNCKTLLEQEWGLGQTYLESVITFCEMKRKTKNKKF